MSEVLRTVFSRADAFKRKLIDALRNPVAKAEQVVGDANDRARGFNELTSQATDAHLARLQSGERGLSDPEMRLAQVMADSYAMGGMVKLVGPRAAALEAARKNAVKMLGLPENNTAMDRAKALGFADDTFHGTFNRFDNFDLSKANPRSQYMPGVFTADKPELAENFGDYIMPLMQRKGTTIKDVIAARNAGLPKPIVDTIHDKAAGIRVTNDPSNIRSRFAAFDPARINENDLLGRADPALLASLGVGTAATVAALRERKKKSDEEK